MNIEEFIIREENTILEAMKRLDSVAKKVLFIVKDDRLLASLTDGDIRRWILSQGSLDAPVRKAANYTPKYATDCSRQEALKYMKQYSVEALPILNRQGRIKSIVLWDDREFLNTSERLDIPVVMMAGGLGTRLHPYTNILPKPLIPIGELPISEHIIRQFVRYGCKRFYMIVNHKKNMIKAYYNEEKKDYELCFEDEEQPLGTGGGLSLLKGKISSSFILTNCDILIQEDFTKIYKHHRQHGNIITMICSLKNFVIPYGVVDIGEEGEIAEMREKPSLSFFTNTGCYIVEPKVIDELEDRVAVSFPEIIEKYKWQGEKVGVYPINENDWMDMGQPDELENMCRRLAQK